MKEENEDHGGDTKEPQLIPQASNTGTNGIEKDG